MTKRIVRRVRGKLPRSSRCQGRKSDLADSELSTCPCPAAANRGDDLKPPTSKSRSDQIPRASGETLEDYFGRIQHAGTLEHHLCHPTDCVAPIAVSELPDPESIKRSPKNLAEFATHFHLERHCDLEELIPYELQKYGQQVIDAAEDALAVSKVNGLHQNRESLRFIVNLYRANAIPIQWGVLATVELL